MSACSDAGGNANLKVTVHIDEEYGGSQTETERSKPSFDITRAHGVLDQDGEKVRVKTKRKNLFSNE